MGTVIPVIPAVSISIISALGRSAGFGPIPAVPLGTVIPVAPVSFALPFIAAVPGMEILFIPRTVFFPFLSRFFRPAGRLCFHLRHRLRFFYLFHRFRSRFRFFRHFNGGIGGLLFHFPVLPVRRPPLLVEPYSPNHGPAGRLLFGSKSLCQHSVAIIIHTAQTARHINIILLQYFQYLFIGFPKFPG
jgi:hypothetical protein